MQRRKGFKNVISNYRLFFVSKGVVLQLQLFVQTNVHNAHAHTVAVIRLHLSKKEQSGPMTIN